jgi:hypothetical protein
MRHIGRACAPTDIGKISIVGPVRYLLGITERTGGTFLPGAWLAGLLTTLNKYNFSQTDYITTLNKYNFSQTDYITTLNKYNFSQTKLSHYLT